MVSDLLHFCLSFHRLALFSPPRITFTLPCTAISSTHPFSYHTLGWRGEKATPTVALLFYFDFMSSDSITSEAFCVARTLPISCTEKAIFVLDDSIAWSCTFGCFQVEAAEAKKMRSMWLIFRQERVLNVDQKKEKMIEWWVGERAEEKSAKVVDL